MSPPGSTPPEGSHDDPLYDIPLLGDLVAKIDALRAASRLGRATSRQEAELYRRQARALRLVANLLDRRAARLERLSRTTDDGHERPRIERVSLE